MDLNALIPSAFRDHPHAATRHLYFDEKPGHITCVFQTHPRRPGNPLRLKVYPPELEKDPENRRKMAKAVYAVSYVLAGTGKVHYTRENRSFEVRPGSMFRFTGHQLDEVVLNVVPGFFECSISVDGATGEHMKALHVWSRSELCTCPGLLQPLMQSYVDLFNKITDLSASPRILLMRYIEFLELVDSVELSNDPFRKFREEARLLLSTRCEPSFEVKDAAEQMGMTYETFRQKFRKVFAISPVEYQLRVRMERACTLLLTCSVKEAANRLGYSDPFIFSRQFKKRIGISPREYKRQLL
jgi:AraC-like DNA-binding protein